MKLVGRKVSIRRVPKLSEEAREKLKQIQIAKDKMTVVARDKYVG